MHINITIAAMLLAALSLRAASLADRVMDPGTYTETTDSVTFAPGICLYTANPVRQIDI